MSGARDLSLRKRILLLIRRGGQAVASEFVGILVSLGLIDDGIDARQFSLRKFAAYAATFAWRLGWPFRAAWHAARATLDALIVASWRRTIMRTIGWLWTAAASPIHQLLGDLGRVNDEIEAQQLSRWSLHLAAAPCLIVTLATIVVGGLVASENTEEIVERYADAVDQASSARDFAAADVLYRRLRQLEPDNAHYAYCAAMLADAQGRTDECAAIMHRLAPVNKSGYHLAHFWQATKLMAAGSIAVDRAWEAQSHLLRTLQGDPYHADAHRLLGELWVSLGASSDALPHLLAAAPSHPEMRLLLARVHAGQGRRDEARAQAEQAYAELSARVEAAPKAPRTRLHLSEAAVLTGRFVRAEELLRGTTDPAWETSVRAALAEVYVAWSRAPTVNSWNLVDQAFRADPWNVSAVNRAIELCGEAGATGDAARSWRTRIERTDNLPASVHTALGTELWRKDRRDEGLRHLEEAHRLAPQLVEATNNLAWMLAHTSNENLSRALELVNSALDQSPGQPNLLDTRITILVKSRCWQDAIGDLWALSRIKPSDASLHLLLADCYVHMNEPELAETHYAEAQRLSANVPGSVTPTPSNSP